MEEYNTETLISRVLVTLQKEHAVIGKTRVNSWNAWLTIGLAAGIVIGITLVSNRSGEFNISQAAVTSSGLVGHWSLDEGSGSTAADSSGNGVNLFLQGGVAWTTGKFGSGIQLNGSNAFLDGTPSSWSGPFTLSVWVRPSAIMISDNGIFSPNVGLYNSSMYMDVGADRNSACYQAYRVIVQHNQGSSAANLCNYTQQAGTWTLLTMTWDGNSTSGTVNFYANGALQSSYTHNPNNCGGCTIGQTFQKYIFGRSWLRDAGYSYFNGTIDEITLYNRVLSGAEIQNLASYDGSAFPASTPPPPPADTTPPVRSSGSPSGALAAGTTQTTISLSTNENATCKYASASGVTYASMQNTFSSTGATAHATTLTGLTNGLSYNYYVRCQDTAGNANTDDFTISFSVSSPAPASDTQAPSTPTNLSATAISSSQINLSWVASTDNVSVAGYKIFRNGAQIATSNTASYSDSGLSSSTSYSYTVAAYDAAGNVSPQSVAISATTQAATVSSGPYSNLQDNTWTLVGSASGGPLGNIGAYSGMAVDTTHQKLLFFGGGHSDYSGNEVWAWDINTQTWQRMYAPDELYSLTQTQCKAQVDQTSHTGMWMLSGRPISRHTYDSVEYDPAVGKMVAGGSSTYSGPGAFMTDYWDNVGDTANNGGCYHISPGDTWLYDYAANSWTYRGSVFNSVPAAGTIGTIATYDSDTAKILTPWAAYDAGTNTWTSHAGFPNIGIIEPSMTYDSKRQAAYLVGSTGASKFVLYKYSVTGDSWAPLSPTGTLPPDGTGMGIVYDSANDVVIMTGMDGATWVYNPGTGQMIQQVASAPFYPAEQRHGKLKYDPVHNIIFLGHVTSYEAGMEIWAYRYKYSATLASPPPPPPPTTTDTTPPSQPTNLNAIALSPSQISLTWSASTDNVAVSGYRIFRNTVQIATSNTASYSDSGLSPSTSYTYAVAAFDAAGNVSAQSTLVSATTQALAVADLSTGLAGYWKFDENLGTTAADSSGNNNTASLLNSPVWSTGVMGGALSFNGVNQFVKIPANSLYESGTHPSMSFSFWMNGNALGGSLQGLITNRNACDNEGPFNMYVQNGQLYFAWYSNLDARTYTVNSSNAILNNGRWNHIVWVRHWGGSTALYVNGVSQGLSGDNSGSATTYSGLNVYVGAENNAVSSGNCAADGANMTQFFNGSIDDVRIYDRALLSSDVQALYAAAPPQPIDFSLSNGGSRSVIQGASFTNTLTASLTAGQTQAISFSVSGLPTGATASFSQTSCSPDCSTTLTVLTAASTPEGTYTITMSGRGGGITRSTSFSLRVNVLTAPPVINTSVLNIPLTIQEALPGVSGINRVQEPATVGIPLAEASGLTNVSQLGLSGANAGQFRVLAHWPNGNIKWVLVDTLADVTAGSKNNSIALTGGTGNFGGSNLAVDNGSNISVDTGAAQFMIKKSNFNIFDSAVVNGQTLVKSGNSGRLAMRDTSNSEFSSANDANSTAVIEENGPVKTVIRADGSFKNSAGARLADYTLRLTFYKGISYVKALAVLSNENSAYPNSNTFFNSADAIVPVTLGTNKTVEFARKVDTVSQTISSTDTAHLYQGYSTDKFNPETVDCYNWTPPIAGTCDSNFTYHYDQTKAGLEVQIGGTNFNSLGNQGDWTQGWGELRDSTGAGVTMTYRWMSSYWPAGFTADGSGNTSIELFSKQNSKTGLLLAFGKNDVREIGWDFHTASQNNNAALYHLQYPLVVQAPFSQYTNTKAIFGQSEFVTADQEKQFFTDMGHPELFPYLGNLSMYQIWRVHAWAVGGGSNQTDFPLNDLQDFLRTGNPGFYLLGEQRTLFNNTAIAHSDASGLPAGFDADPYRHSSMDGGFIDMEHSHILSLPFYYYLTGNEWIKQGVLDYGKYLDYTERINYFKMPTNVYDRAWSRKFRNMALVYEFTCYTGTCNSTYGNYVTSWLNYQLDTRDAPPNQYPQGRNTDRGYLWWETEEYAAVGTRTFEALTKIQIHIEALWQALRVIGDTGLAYARKQDALDYLTGLSQFIFNEDYDEINGGTAEGNFGFMYLYPLDTSYTIGSNWYLALDPYDASRAAIFGYQQTGDQSMLSKAEKLIWAITDFATGRSPSELQDQALMYTYFNPPQTTWKYITPTVSGSGGSYTLTWNVPSGTSQYQIKYASKPIVDWLGFNKSARAYQYNPSQHIPFFAANNITNNPAPLTGGTQSINLSGLSCASNCYFAMKYLGTGAVNQIPAPTQTQATSTPISPTPPQDTISPIISNISSSSLTINSAIIIWTTDEPSDSQVEYGLTTLYGSASTLNTTLTTSHSIILSNLSSGSAYNFRVKSKDAAGNLATSLNNTFTTLPAPDTQAPNPVADLSYSGLQSNSATFSWSAPSDLPGGGAVASYDIRYSASPITSSNFSSATQATGEPNPSSPGTSQTYILAGLQPSTLYYAAIASADSAGNISPVSDVVFFTTSPAVDTTSPSISSVLASSITSSSATISWTTNENADSQVEYGPTSAYGSATALNSTLLTSHSQILSGLLSGTVYHYRVKSKDASGNLAVSGDFAFTILTPPDTTSPATISILNFPQLTSNFITISWIATGDDGSVGTAASYELRYSTSPIDAGNFSSAALVPNLPAPKPAGSTESFTIGGLLPDTVYYFGLRVADEAGNVSGISFASQKTASATVADTTSPVISNVLVSNITSDSATITWTTDELSDSTLKYGTSTSLINTINQSNLVISHSKTITGLQRKTTYSYQVSSKDSSGNNTSSPTFIFQTANGKPAPVKNLQARSGSVILSWTLPDTDPFIRKYLVYRSTSGYPAFNDLTSKLGETSDLVQTTYTDTATSYSTVYYYSLFTLDDTNIFSDAANVSFVTPSAPGNTQVTPGSSGGGGNGGGGGGGFSLGNGAEESAIVPTGFQAVGAPDQVLLFWKNPTDAGFVRVKVVRKEGSVPLSPNDGALVYEGDKQEFTDTKVSADSTYYYGIFSLDRNLSVSSLATISVKVGEKTVSETQVAVSKTAAQITRKSGYFFTKSLQLGSTHQDVLELQKFLNALGLTVSSSGIGSQGHETIFFGELTKQALSKFQAQYMPEVPASDRGIVGPKTRAKLNAFTLSEAPAQNRAAASVGLPLTGLTGPFAFGYKNDQVKLLQQYLAKDPSIYPNPQITGYYGNLTKEAVKRFQAKYGIEQTGLAGPATRKKLNEVYGK